MTVAYPDHGLVLEVFEPRAAGLHPLILMLHGSVGVFTSNERARRTQGDNFGERELASECFVIVLPHYLEALGFKSMTSELTILEHAGDLKAVAQRALDKAITLPSVDRKRVGIYGESLGGFLAVEVAASDARVIAVSATGTAEPPDFQVENPNWKALLLQHGTMDTLVPFRGTVKLAEEAERNGVAVELIPYMGEDHYFSESSRKSELAHTVRFFNENLQRASTGPNP